MKITSMLVSLSVLVAATGCLAAELPDQPDSAAAVAIARASKLETDATGTGAATAAGGVAEGVALIKNGDFHKAVSVLRAIVKSSPDNVEANFYLGMALNRLSEKEAESVLKASLMQAPDSPYVNFELGIYYFNKNIDAEAGDYFENVIALSPGSEHATQARMYLKRIEGRGKPKSWEVNFLSGMQYDSNVMVMGNGPLPAGISNKDDFNAVLNPKVSYFLHKDGKKELTASYSLYQTLHTTLSDFDVTLNTFDLSAGYAIAPKVKLKGSYSFEYMLLGGNLYDHAHVLAPSICYDFYDWGSTVLEYKLRNTSYTNSAAFNTNTDRNGVNHYVGLTHTVPIGKSYFVWGGYSHDEDLTSSEFWNYHGNRVAAGFRGALPYDMMGDFSGEYYAKQYAATDPSYPGLVRHDDQFMVSLTLMKVISETFTLMAMEQYTRNFSNLVAFDTTRAVTSLFLNVRF